MTEPLSTLYPEIEPYAVHHLDVGDGHTVYVEECGNRAGTPVVFVHGGPGGGTSPKSRRFFDPAAYRIVLFDQRGCGKSTPFASLAHNTTDHLTADMERIREALGIARWVVFGGSWGSTLSLAYAQAHPQRVRALVLRGIFLLRRFELEWFYQQGASHVFPDFWEDFIAPIPPGERGDLISAYHKRLTDPDPAVRLPACRAWSIWEGRTVHLHPDLSAADADFGNDRFAEAFARIECHYFVNGGFLAEGQLLAHAPALAGIPGVIVQGRYDMCTPARSAWELHRAWPGSKLVWVTDAGHSAYEPGITSALITATDAFRRAE